MTESIFQRKCRSSWLSVFAALTMLQAGCATQKLAPDSVGLLNATKPTYYTTKTPYAPQQQPQTYEPAPTGFLPVQTQLVARHGARGMSSAKHDLALLDLWNKAKVENALTPLGRELGPDLMLLIRTNALLGYGIEGISKPGYGNLSRLGIQEHTELAARMVARVPKVFETAVSSRSAATPAKSVIVLSSGVDRAIDSAYFFKASLLKSLPALAPAIVEPIVASYPTTEPKAQRAGVNRFLLYFHKLNEKTDFVGNAQDVNWSIYQSSQRYQAYQQSRDVLQKLEKIQTDAAIRQSARAVLEGIFTKSFVDKVEIGTITASSVGNFSFPSDDGKYTAILSGDGKTKIEGLVEAALALSSVYEIAPGLRVELARDFNRYIPDREAAVLAFPNDAEDFYVKGPSIREFNPVTYQMAQGLLDDFFKYADVSTSDGASTAAVLRFSHAEIIVPFASLLELPNVFVPVPTNALYSYATNPWRGELVAPYTANVQWDIFRNVSGEVIVRMLYNEKETAFKPSCDAARYRPGSFYYRLPALKACYAPRR